ncbi:MAG: amino acid ABC transporter permease [Lachnospiraceae bacterium]|nr:amino acid ABC transporter permease [Lachnospiraceae bacterium]
MYLVKGLGNTVTITIFALLLGVALGFLIALIRVSAARDEKQSPVLKILNMISGLYLTIIRGTPIVVQLMIMYFVILASGAPVLIAILSFGINSGAYVAEVIRSGIQSIDRGQTEAGRSLGLNGRQTMMYIILPQAFKNVAPAIFNEFIALLKETSVAGYVGIQDLTKGGDIIRSLTYDAFPPLLMVAAIYLVIVIFLTMILHKIEGRLAKSDLR